MSKIPMPKQGKNRVAVYRRVGSPHQLEAKSAALYCRIAYPAPDALVINAQQQLLRDFAKARGFVNCAEYADIGCNGLTFDNRPAFARMVADIKAGKIDTVIVRGIDRIARDVILTHKWLIEMASYGVKVMDTNGWKLRDFPAPFMSVTPSQLQ